MSTAHIIADAIIKVAIVWSPVWGGALGYVVVTRKGRAS